MKATIVLAICCSTLFAGEFDGTWLTGCTSQGSTNERYRVVMNGAQATMQNMQYKDNQCTTQTVLASTSGPVAFPPADSTAKFDLTHNDFTLTLMDASLVRLANMLEYCGLSNWKKDVPMDVAGKSCGEEVTFPKVGDKYYSIVGLNAAGELLLGLRTEALNASAPEKRPVDLDTANPFIKQP